MPLHAVDQPRLARADSTRISQIFPQLVKNWRKQRWLSAGNRYAFQCVERIATDTQVGGPGLRHTDMQNYVAASSVIHCMDSWSYLARAIEAELSGDFSGARHLAYYAELRAAMSLLASGGIGVFNRKHVSVKANRRCESIGKSGGTHEFAWDALEYWSAQPVAAQQVLDVIRPGGKALLEWLMHFPTTAGAGFQNVLASRWITDWGLDLQQFPADRDARNESSYRPTTITKKKTLAINESLDFVRQFWQMHEPSGLNPFKELDRHLLRRSLSRVFKESNVGKNGPLKAPTQFKRLLRPMLHGILPTGGDLSEQGWWDFLTYKVEPKDSQLILLAEVKDPHTSPKHHLQVIARATLLLRVATGVTRMNITKLNATDVKHLDFWWKPIGLSRGFWSEGAIPHIFSDLWQDIDDSLSDVETWRSAGNVSRRDMFDGVSRASRSLSGCERIAFWSLGL